MGARRLTLEEYSRSRRRQASLFRKYGLVLLFVAPYFAFFAVFFLYPLVKGLVMSLYKYNYANPADNEWRGLENFYKILFDSSSSYFKDFWSSLGRTAMAAAILVPLCILIPLLLAYLINTKPWGYKWYRAILYIPGIFPLTATGVIFLNLFNYQYGFINSLFGTDVNWLLNPSSTWVVIILFCVWGGIGTNFVIFSAGLQNNDRSLAEAGLIDGANKLQQIICISLPQIKNQLIICLFTTITGYMNLYGQNYILGAFTQPQKDIYTVIYVIQNQLMGTRYEVYGMMAAMAICLGFFTALISGLQMFVTRERKGGHRHEKAFLAYKERL